ncbi:MAG: DUF11 domain-containing protein [Firmicutes bacterium]|nr:DUF11 domain-containing protein [Bacillota bacterium]
MIRRVIVALSIAVMLTAAMAASVSATGTLAGTSITNNSTVTFKDVNNNPKPAITSNTVTTTVNAIRGVDVSNGYVVSTEDKIVDFGFVVTNTGNGYDTFSLGLTGVPAGWSARIYHNTNRDGALDPGETTITGSTGQLDPNPPTVVTNPTAYDYWVFVRVIAPDAPAVVNQTVNLVFTAKSDSDSTVTDAATIQLTVKQAVVDIVKTAGNPNPMPLEPFDYTVQVSNSGAVQAYNVIVKDTLPEGLQYIGPVLLDADGPGPGLPTTVYNSFSNGAITVNLYNLSASTTAVITFKVQVTGEIPYSTVISNTAQVTYDDKPLKNDHTAAFTDASTVQISVANRAGVDIGSDYSGYADPGDEVRIPFTIINTGNGADHYTISAANTGSLALTWRIYLDEDGDGTYERLVGVTDASDPTVGDTPSMSKDDIGNFMAVATVPAGAMDGTVNTLVITATSNRPPVPHAKDSITLKTTARAPYMSLIESVNKGTAKPGDILTYTITLTNVGNGDAKEVTVSDVISEFAVYVADSITVDGIAQTDTVDSDYASYQSGKVTVFIPTVQGKMSGETPKTQFVITFQVRVK